MKGNGGIKAEGNKAGLGEGGRVVGFLATGPVNT